MAVLCRTGIVSKKIDAPASTDSESRLESLWHLHKWGRQEIVVGAVYRVPRNSTAALEADFTELDAQYQHILLHYPGRTVIIGGDLNCCMLADTVSHPGRRSLTEFLTRYSLSQVISSPTYSTGSLLDVFIVNRDIVKQSGTRFCHFSPHRFTRLICDIPRLRHKPAVTISRNLRNIDLAASMVTYCAPTGVQCFRLPL